MITSSELSQVFYELFLRVYYIELHEPIPERELDEDYSKHPLTPVFMHKFLIPLLHIAKNNGFTGKYRRPSASYGFDACMTYISNNYGSVTHEQLEKAFGIVKSSPYGMSGFTIVRALVDHYDNRYTFDSYVVNCHHEVVRLLSANGDLSSSIYETLSPIHVYAPEGTAVETLFDFNWEDPNITSDYIESLRKLADVMPVPKDTKLTLFTDKLPKPYEVDLLDERSVPIEVLRMFNALPTAYIRSTLEESVQQYVQENSCPDPIVMQWVAKRTPVIPDMQQTVSQDLMNANVEVKRLRGELTETHAQRDMLMDKVQSLENTIKSLRAECATAKEDLAKSAVREQAARAENTDEVNRINGELRKALEASTRAEAELRRAQEMQSRQRKQTESEIAQLHATVDELTKKLAEVPEPAPITEPSELDSCIVAILTLMNGELAMATHDATIASQRKTLVSAIQLICAANKITRIGTAKTLTKYADTIGNESAAMVLRKAAKLV